MFLGEASDTNKRCDYRMVEAGQCTAVGLPPGVDLKRPATYGKATLEAVLRAEPDLQFGKDFKVCVNVGCVLYIQQIDLFGHVIRCLFHSNHC